MKKRPVTLKDVAERAGVSTTTASMVMRGTAERYGISAETIRRVQTLAAELGFVPNRLASSFSTGRSHMIGIMPSDPKGLFDSWYGPRILKGCVAEARKQKYHIMLIDESPAWNEEPPNQFASQLVGNRIEGLLIMEDGMQTGLEPYVEVAVTLPMPVQSIAIHGMPRLAYGVGVDYGQIAGAALDHLTGLGHSKIGLVLYNRHLLEIESLIDQFGREMRMRGLSFPDDCILESRPGRTALIQAVQKRRITAALVLHDGNAMRIVRRFQEQGIAIPDDFSIISLGDYPLSSEVSPPLTTLRPPMTELGEAATRVLLQSIEEGDTRSAAGAANAHSLPAELVVRKSTAPPRD